MKKKYKTIKSVVPVVIALLGVGLTIRGAVNVALPGELQDNGSLMLLVGFAAFSGLIFWIASRAIFWVPEFWMPIQEENVSRFHVGVTRLSRLLAVIVPIGVFFFNLSNERFPPRIGSISGAVMGYILIGGATWLAIQATGWVVEGFRRR